MEHEEGVGLARQARGSLWKPTTTLTVGALERALLAEFPAEDAEEWDRTGLLVGDRSRPVTAVAVALDPTVSAIERTADLGADVLLTHHPAYLTAPQSFRPAASVALCDGAGVYAAVSRGVALMNFHTALDVSAPAQRVLPGLLGLRLERVALPSGHDPSKGYGQVCALSRDESLSAGQLAARCMAVFGRQPRVWGDMGRALRQVVTCTGSAGDVGAAALAAGADALVCGEVKYHAALDLSQAGLVVVDLGHDVSELPLAGLLAQTLRELGLPDDMVMLLEQGENWAVPEAVRV